MSRHERGLYEVLITEALNAQLGDLGDRLEVRRSDLRPAEAADRIALHLARVIQRVVAAVSDEDRVGVSVALARRLIEQVDATVAGADVLPDSPLEPGSVLRSLVGMRPDGKPETYPSRSFHCSTRPSSRMPPASPESETRSWLRSTRRTASTLSWPSSAGVASRRCSMPSVRIEPWAARSESSRRRTRERPNRAPWSRFATLAPKYAFRTTPARLGFTPRPGCFIDNRASRRRTSASSNLTHSAQVTGLEWNVRVSGARTPRRHREGRGRIRELLEWWRLRSL